MTKPLTPQQRFLVQLNRITEQIYQVGIVTRNDIITLKGRLTRLRNFLESFKDSIPALINSFIYDFAEQYKNYRVLHNFIHPLHTRSQYVTWSYLYNRLVRQYKNMLFIKYIKDSSGYIRSVRVVTTDDPQAALARWMAAVNAVRFRSISRPNYDPILASERWRVLYTAAEEDSGGEAFKTYSSIMRARLSFLEQNDAPYWPFFEYGNTDVEVPGSVGGFPTPTELPNNVLKALEDHINTNIKAYFGGFTISIEQVFNNLLEETIRLRQFLADYKTIDSFYKDLDKIRAIFKRLKNASEIISRMGNV